MSSFESYIVLQVALEIYPLPDTPTIDYVAIPDPHLPAPLNLVALKQRLRRKGLLLTECLNRPRGQRPRQILRRAALQNYVKVDP